MIDYHDLIGIQFEYGGRDLNALDCYGLVMLIHERMGKKLPDYRSPEALTDIALLMAGEKYRWEQKAVKEGDNLISFKDMQPGRVLEIKVKGLACHVGFIHRPRYFLHTWEGTGGVTEESLSLWHRNILGVYEYRG